MKKFLSLLLVFSLMTNCLTAPKTSALGSVSKDEILTNLIELHCYEDKGGGTFLSLPISTGDPKSWFSKITNPLVELGQLGYMISGITIGLSSLSSLWDLGKSVVNKVKEKPSKVELDTDKAAKSMDEQIKNIKGQEKATKKDCLN